MLFNKMYIKIHRSYRNVVAVCDSNLIGKRFEEGKRQLDIRENFFKGEEVGMEGAVKLLRRQLQEDSTFNIIGKDSINACIEAGVIKKGEVDEIDGIPFAIVLI